MRSMVEGERPGRVVWLAIGCVRPLHRFAVPLPREAGED